MLNLDIAKICRICLKANPRLSPLFAKPTSFDDGISIAEMILQCTNCNVCQEDQFPSRICNECIERAHGAYKFKKLCEASYRTLTAFFSSIEGNSGKDLASNASNNESLKTEEFTPALSQAFVKSEHEATETKEVFGTVAIKNEADASEAFFEGNCGAEPTSLEYKQEDEFIIKGENVLDVDNENRREADNKSESLSYANCEEQSEEKTVASDANYQNTQKRQKNATTKLSSSATRRTNKRSRTLEKRKRHKCPDPDCDKAFTRAIYLRYHNRLHTGEKPFACDVCSKAFARPETLKVHKRLHTGEKYFKCRDCKEAFFHANRLAAHRSKFHDGEDVFQCEYCTRKFKTAETLDRHRKTFHSEEKPHKCNVCDASFKHSCDLIAHKSLHDESYKCQVCEASFKSEKSLNTHKRTHAHEKPFKCKYCSVSFAHYSGLVPHEMWHSGEQAHKCEECQAAFTHSNSLAAHRRWHTPYKCEKCDAAFTQFNSLVDHKRALNHGTAHMCHDCGKTYTSVEGLADHRRVAHIKCSTYKCGNCSKTFLSSTSLDESEKPHSCPDCGEATCLTTNKSLTELRPFKCPDCNKSFSYLTTLAGHRSRFHTNVKSSTK